MYPVLEDLTLKCNKQIIWVKMTLSMECLMLKAMHLKINFKIILVWDLSTVVQ